MANNPKKVNDPTEVALSAIQEALNISDAAADTNRHLMRDEAALSIPPATPTYSETPFDTRASSERSSFDTNEQPRPARRAANDDRETIGQILQAIQKGRPARNVYTLATLFAGVWVIGCGLLTVSFLPALQAAIGQGSGGVLVLAGLAALFFAPVLLFYFLASLAWRGQELRMIAQSMAQVAIRFSEPEGTASDSMVTVGQAIRREVAAMGDGIERAIAHARGARRLRAPHHQPQFQDRPCPRRIRRPRRSCPRDAERAHRPHHRRIRAALLDHRRRHFRPHRAGP